MICRICGNDATGQPFNEWVRDTFTNYDRLRPGEIICNDCLFWFTQGSTPLAQKMGKDKPQKMQNYSHFIVNGEWIPLSKSDKARMIELLLSGPFPELAAIADSGQKHIVFRATRNQPGSKAGWVQFEEQRLWVEPQELKTLIETIESGLSVFSKTEIETGRYLPHRIIEFGLSQWQALEMVVKPQRESLLFQLALFLSQKKEIENNGATITGNSGGFAGNSLARDRQRVQESLPSNDLVSIREYSEGGELHKQPGEIHQLGLF